MVHSFAFVRSCNLTTCSSPQLQLYADKFTGFQDTLTSSNDMFKCANLLCFDMTVSAMPSISLSTLPALDPTHCMRMQMQLFQERDGQNDQDDEEVGERET